MLVENLLGQMAGHSRVWIYMANRTFSEAEEIEIESQLTGFCSTWAAHGQSLSSSGIIINKCFIVLCVDENRAGASGCSIDKSLHFIKSIENRFGVSLTDRQLIAYKGNDEIKTFRLEELDSLVRNGILTHETLIFDNLVTSLNDLRTRWLTPAKNTWLRRFWPKEANLSLS